MILRFTVLLRDREAFFALRHDSCLSFLLFFLVILKSCSSVSNFIIILIYLGYQVCIIAPCTV